MSEKENLSDCDDIFLYPENKESIQWFEKLIRILLSSKKQSEYPKFDKKTIFAQLNEQTNELCSTPSNFRDFKLVHQIITLSCIVAERVNFWFDVGETQSIQSRKAKSAPIEREVVV